MAGKWLVKYRRSHGIEIADALIAASAVENNAELWTGNRKHYPMKDLSFFDCSLKPHFDTPAGAHPGNPARFFGGSIF